MDEKKGKGKSRPDPDEKPRVVKGPADLQRLRLEKLMKNPEKPVIIPERPKGKNMPSAPDFVRNVMGSSAGAGSGEFHVYRHLRRKEYSRQKFIQEKSEKDILDDEYRNKLESNKKAADERTAKKRAKRLKKKQHAKVKAKMAKTNKPQNESDKDESSEEECSNDDNSDNTEKAVIVPIKDYTGKAVILPIEDNTRKAVIVPIEEKETIENVEKDIENTVQNKVNVIEEDEKTE